MMILKGIIIVFMLFLVPLLIGDFICNITAVKKSVVMDFVIGTITMFAVFQLIAVPLILMRQSFNTAIILWGAIIAILIIMSLKNLIFNIKKGGNFGQIDIGAFRAENKLKQFTVICTGVVAIALIGFQCYMYVAYQHVDSDDSRYIVNALEAYNSNTMLVNNPVTGEEMAEWSGELIKDVVSPWMIYVALLSRIAMIAPAIFAHCILPVMLLVLTYSVYWLLGVRIFKKDISSIFLMLMLISIMHIWGYASVYTDSTFLLTRIWQGKAIVAGIMIPLLIMMLLNIYVSKKIDGNYILLFIGALATDLLSGIGILLSVIMVITFGICYAISKRRLKILLLSGLICSPGVIYAGIYYMLSL